MLPETTIKKLNFKTFCDIIIVYLICICYLRKKLYYMIDNDYR